MNARHWNLPLAWAAVIGTTFALAPSAGAQCFGLCRLPSRPAQYLGVGYGAGHHAPIVRTPWQHPDRVHRMAIAPRCQGPLYPEAYAPIGCYGADCQLGPPAPYSPVLHPAPTGVDQPSPPQPIPTAAPTPAPAPMPRVSARPVRMPRVPGMPFLATPVQATATVPPMARVVRQ